MKQLVKDRSNGQRLPATFITLGPKVEGPAEVRMPKLGMTTLMALRDDGKATGIYLQRKGDEGKGSSMHLLKIETGEHKLGEGVTLEVVQGIPENSVVVDAQREITIIVRREPEKAPETEEPEREYSTYVARDPHVFSGDDKTYQMGGQPGKDVSVHLVIGDRRYPMVKVE